MSLYKKKIALILGATSDIGSYLCELLLEKQYTVYATTETYNPNIENLKHLFNRDGFYFYEVSLLDHTSVNQMLLTIKDAHSMDKNCKYNAETFEIYHLDDFDNISLSKSLNELTTKINCLGTQAILNSIRNLDLDNIVRIFLKSSAEIFGNQPNEVLNELSKHQPNSIYGISKLQSFLIGEYFKSEHQLFISQGILFDHFSERSQNYNLYKNIYDEILSVISKKIECATIKCRNIRRDIGDSKDFSLAIWKSLQHSTPENFVISSGNNMSVKEFIEQIFKKYDSEVTWSNGKVFIAGYGNNHTKIVEMFEPSYKKIDTSQIKGDSTKITKVLGWSSPKLDLSNY